MFPQGFQLAPEGFQRPIAPRLTDPYARFVKQLLGCAFDRGPVRSSRCCPGAAQIDVQGEQIRVLLAGEFPHDFRQPPERRAQSADLGAFYDGAVKAGTVNGVQHQPQPGGRAGTPGPATPCRVAFVRAIRLRTPIAAPSKDCDESGGICPAVRALAAQACEFDAGELLDQPLESPHPQPLPLRGGVVEGGVGSDLRQLKHQHGARRGVIEKGQQQRQQLHPLRAVPAVDQAQQLGYKRIDLEREKIQLRAAVWRAVALEAAKEGLRFARGLLRRRRCPVGEALRGLRAVRL